MQTCCFHICLQIFETRTELSHLLYELCRKTKPCSTNTAAHNFPPIAAVRLRLSLHCLVSTYALLQSKAVVKSRVAHKTFHYLLPINTRHIGTVKPHLQHSNPQSWFHKFLIKGCAGIIYNINMLPSLILVSYWKSQIIE